MKKSTNEVKPAADYRGTLRAERDGARSIVDDGEARLPELKRVYDASVQELKDHIASVYLGGHNGQHSLQPERDRLYAVRQEAYDALQACERALQAAKPRLAELDRWLGADAAVEQLTASYTSGLLNAGAAERKVKAAEEMIAAIDVERAGRAERRQQVADANAAAHIEHAEAALVARGEGKPVPAAPLPRHPAKGDESDTDLDSQRSAATRMRDKYADELHALTTELTATRNRLIQVRFDAAEFKANAALFGIRAEIIEYEAACQVASYYGRDLVIQRDDLAVRARANAIEQELRPWTPMAATVDDGAGAEQQEDAVSKAA
jgi:hypothetical protein